MAEGRSPASPGAPALPVHRWCLAIAVGATALERLIEDGDLGGYRDSEPWHVAADLLAQARGADETLIMLLASGEPLGWVRWARVTDIEVHEYASTRETRVRFSGSGPVNPIFEALDSVVLRPPAHQLERERREGLRRRRIHVDPSWLHGYAICETPAYLLPDPAQAARTGVDDTAAGG